jgi:hypothetical protein
MNRGSYSTEQMIALHGFFAEGAAVGEALLADLSGCATEVEVVEVRCGLLDEFGDRGLRAGDDLVAAVLGRVEGGLPDRSASRSSPKMPWSGRAPGLLRIRSMRSSTSVADCSRAWPPR